MNDFSHIIEIIINNPLYLILAASLALMIVWSLMKATIGIRLSKEAETKGTDVTETGVIAYAIRD